MAEMRPRKTSRSALFLLTVACAAPAAGGAGTAEVAQVRHESGPRSVWTDKDKNPKFRGLDGLNHKLDEWQGKVIVLNFWASWCSPCLYEIRDFVTYQQQYNDKGLQVIGIGMDDDQKLANVQRTLDMNYPVLIADPKSNSKLMQAWGNSSGVIPYSVLIDRKGRILATYRGVLEREVFDEDIKPLLND